jgi:hypothetical protein
MAAKSYFTQLADDDLKAYMEKTSPVHKPQIVSTPEVKKIEMAASSFALACDALVRERDRVFLQKISDDYKIPFSELEAKYMTSAEDAIKVPKVRKAKVSVEGANKCQAQTAKKGPCSFAALKGECYCKRHLAQQNAEPKPPKDPKEPKVKEPKPVKLVPVHTHEPSSTKIPDCDLCDSHGTGLEEDEEEEFEVMMSDYDDE